MNTPPSSIRPGQPWLDTQGKRIQAHGGSVMYLDGTYYWYGENKEKTDGKNGIWHWGVRCYASADLYNWEDKGLIIPPEPEDPNSSLHPSASMDRPHILYNQRTKKFVCWLKIMNRDKTQTETVLTADHILGPYTKVREGLRPLGMSAGDFDLAVAPDGKAYYYFERVHSETICADLTDDYTDVTGYYSTHFPHAGPPYVREATAHFCRKGKHYLVTSGTTGYLPNPSEVAMADTWHGPYTVLGDPHPTDPSHTSFHSQISSVFQVVGKKGPVHRRGGPLVPSGHGRALRLHPGDVRVPVPGQAGGNPSPGGEIRHPAPCRGQGAGHLHRGLRLAALPF